MGVYLTTVAVTVGAAGCAAGLAAVSAGARARQRAARDAGAGEVEAALAAWPRPPPTLSCCGGRGGGGAARRGGSNPLAPSDRGYRALRWLAVAAAGGAWLLAAWMVLLFAAHVSASMAMASVVRGTGQAIQSLEAAVAGANQTLGAARYAGTALAGLTAGLTAQARQAGAAIRESLPPSAGALAEAVRVATHREPKPPPAPGAAAAMGAEAGGGLIAPPPDPAAAGAADGAADASRRKGAGSSIAAGLSSAFEGLVGGGEARPGTVAPSARLVAPRSERVEAAADGGGQGQGRRRRLRAAEVAEAAPAGGAAPPAAATGSPAGATPAAADPTTAAFPRFDPSAAANGMLSIINALQPTQQGMLTAAAGAQRVAESARRVVGGAAGGAGDGGEISDGTVCPSVVCLDVRLFAFLKSDACICTAADLHTVRALAADVGGRVRGSLVGVVLMYVGSSALLARLAADAARISVDRGVVWGDLHAVHGRRRAAARGRGEEEGEGGGRGGSRSPSRSPAPAAARAHMPAPSAPAGTPTLGAPKGGGWLPGL